MARRMRIDVIFDKRAGQWLVKSGGEAYSFGTKEEAVRQAAAVGRGVGGVGSAQVVIRKKDGKIQSERTYGTDRRRSKG
jgi:hypothetical protein